MMLWNNIQIHYGKLFFFLQHFVQEVHACILTNQKWETQASCSEW